MVGLERSEDGWTHRVGRKGEWTMECHVTCSCGLTFTSLVPLSIEVPTKSPFLLIYIILAETVLALCETISLIIILHKQRAENKKLNIIG